jgi:hypothetical protein
VLPFGFLRGPQSGKYYGTFDYNLTYAQARAHCEALGASHATFRTPEEAEDFASLIRESLNFLHSNLSPKVSFVVILTPRRILYSQECLNIRAKSHKGKINNFCELCEKDVQHYYFKLLHFPLFFACGSCLSQEKPKRGKMKVPNASKAI